MAKRDINPYIALANAIVVQACEDYKKAYRRISLGKGTIFTERLIEDVFRFFHSKWFKTLTDVDVNYLEKKLKEDVDERAASDYADVLEKVCSGEDECTTEERIDALLRFFSLDRFLDGSDEDDCEDVELKEES